MKEANRNTVFNREPSEEAGQPYTFEGNVVAEGEDITDTATHRTRVYDTFDGFYLLEHTSQSLVEGEPLGDRYEIVPATKLRTTLIMNCPTGAIARQIGEQMGLEITDADFPTPPPPTP